MFQASTHSSKLSWKPTKKSQGPEKLNGLLNWIEGFVLTDSFDAVVRTSFASEYRNERLQKEVRDLIDVLIYQAYDDPGGRTYKLKESFKVETGTPKDPMQPGVTVFSDVDVATAKSGKAAGEFSYAAFFEKPVKFDSFIKDYEGHLYGVVRFRPFMEELTKLVHDESELNAIHALFVAMRKRMPGVRGKSK